MTRAAGGSGRTSEKRGSMNLRVSMTVALAACLLAAGGCGGAPPSHSPSPAAHATAPSSELPQAAATLAVATLRLAPTSTALLAATGSQAYVVVLPPEARPLPRSIRVVELAADGRLLRQRSLPVGRVYAGDVMHVAAGPDGLYVGTEVLRRFTPRVPDELLRIDPTTLAIVARARFAAGVSACEQERRLWAAIGDGRVVRLDPLTLKVLASRRVVPKPTPLTAPMVSVSTPAVGAGDLWVLASDEQQRLELIRMDPGSLAVRSRTLVSSKHGPLPWQAIQAVAAGAGGVFLWGSRIVPVTPSGVLARPIGSAGLPLESRSTTQPELESLATEGATLVALFGGPTSALVELDARGHLLAETVLGGSAGELATSGRNAWLSDGRRFVHVRLRLQPGAATLSGAASTATPPAPSATPAPTAGADGRPSPAAIAVAVRRLLAQPDPGFEVERLTHIEVARDSRGRWWVSAYAVPPASAQEETPQVVIVESAGRWRLAGQGTDIATTLGIEQMHVPKDVVQALFPGGVSQGGG
jgi:hypothetical protein